MGVKIYALGYVPEQYGQSHSSSCSRSILSDHAHDMHTYTLTCISGAAIRVYFTIDAFQRLSSWGLSFASVCMIMSSLLRFPLFSVKIYGRSDCQATSPNMLDMKAREHSAFRLRLTSCNVGMSAQGLPELPAIRETERKKEWSTTIWLRARWHIYSWESSHSALFPSSRLTPRELGMHIGRHDLRKGVIVVRLWNRGSGNKGSELS